MFEFRLPDLGEGIHEGELLKWHVAQGDKIQEDDPLCDMETDKAAVTIPSPRTGTVAALKAAAGDTVRVGEVFAVIDDGSQEAGGQGERNQVEGGRGDVEVGDDRGDTDPAEGPPGPSLKSPDAGRPEGRVIAAPATRRLAREMGIDIRRVRGTGPGGRVIPGDLEAFDAGMKAPADPERSPADSSQAVPIGAPGQGIPFFEIPEPIEPDGPAERIPIRSLRRKTAVKTTSSAIMVPHVAHMEEVDVSEIEALRKAYNDRHGEEGKLTLLAFVVKAVTAALKTYPMFNASVDTAAAEIVHKFFYNIGFAADTPQGLMVPVIQDADRKSLAETGMRIRYLAQKAREGKVEVHELTGGTFTITNVGVLGGTHLFPIINIPETAILGMGRVEKKPVVREDQVVIRNILPLTLCFDHRAADGAQAAAFVGEIKTMLEDRLEFMGRT